MAEALDLGNISTRRRRIAEIARVHKGEGLRTLSHFIDIYWLYEAWRLTKKSGAGERSFSVEAPSGAESSQPIRY